MDAEYLNLIVLKNSIGLVVCGLLGAGFAWAAKRYRDPAMAVVALVSLVTTATCGYHVARVYVAPQTVLAERAAK